jgi:hypothetical protein
MSETATHSFMPGCNPLVQQARQDFIETLYEQDGRHDPEHPLHAHYTGLWELYIGHRCTDEDQ